MTRTYAAKRLLEHGALTFAEFHAITGWTEHQARSTLQQLRLTGMIDVQHGDARRKYALPCINKTVENP